MSKTNELKVLIKQLLDETEGETYHRQASDKALFPYKVYALTSVNLGDLNRDDYILEVDIWDKSQDGIKIDALADQIEKMLNAFNCPTGSILPTFYRESRKQIDDDNKDYKRIWMKFSIQNYEKE